MTLSPDTIRTVIEIVPDWFKCREQYLEGAEIYEYPCGELRIWYGDWPQPILDALAAAAVRVVDEMDYELHIIGGCTMIFKPVAGHLITQTFGEGPNRTENTLEAIAEFVKSGGFESE